MKFKLGHNYFLEVQGEKYYLCDWEGRTEIKVEVTFDKLLDQLKTQVKYLCNNKINYGKWSDKLFGASPFLKSTY